MTSARAGGRAGRVIVVGSVNVDLVVTVDRLPAPGETVIGGRFARHHGGKGGNQAVAAARLGASTVLVGAVGDDDLGATAREALVAEGVEVSSLEVMPGAETGVAVILVGADGENQIAVASGANGLVTGEGVAKALGRLAVRGGDVVLVGHEIPTEAAVVALRVARAAGATAILNPAPPDGLSAEALVLADVVTPNRSEAARLAAAVGGAGAGGRAGDDVSGAMRMGGISGDAGDRAGEEPSAAMRMGGISAGADGPASDAEAAADALLTAMGPDGAVLLTLGAEGALLDMRPIRIRLEAPSVEAVDTVGAGDTLNGALAAALARGVDLETAAHEAVAAASIAVTRPGAREGMPTTAELRAFLDGPAAG